MNARRRVKQAATAAAAARRKVVASFTPLATSQFATFGAQSRLNQRQPATTTRVDLRQCAQISARFVAGVCRRSRCTKTRKREQEAIAADDHDVC